MIYFDNAATSYPKPQNVIYEAQGSMKLYSFNSGRSGYYQSVKAGERIYSVREKIADMFSFSPDRVVFTKNCTEALNIAISGSVKRGEHIIISSLEHNSVARVVEGLRKKGIADYSVADFSYDDEQTVKSFENLIRDNTALVVCMHSSNAFGVTFPIKRIGEMCKRHNIRFVVDGAQGVGSVDINAKRDNIDILCAPGHKCLMGNMGTGFLAFGDDVDIEGFMLGGTGSSSLSLSQPDFYPDKLEAGTLNNSGILSLGAGIDYINAVGIEKIYNHEMKLCRYLYDNLRENKNVILYTPAPENYRSMPIISFNYSDYPSEKTAYLLSKNAVCTRAGFHCSPLAHKHFNTVENGTVRVSLGAFNTMRECNSFLNIVKKL